MDAHVTIDSPIIDLSPGLVQVGTSSARTVILTRDAAQILRERHDSDGHESLPPDLAATLEQAGLIENEAARQSLARLRIRISGLGKIGCLLAWALVEAGVRYLDVRDGRPVDQGVEHLYPPELKGLRRDRALRQWMIPHGIRTSRQGRPDLAITVDERVIDWQSATLFLANDIPHLPIIVDEAEVSIGPLFIPGVTLCYQCVEASRTEGLSSWDKVRRLLATVPVPEPSLALAQCAAGFTATFILSLLHNTSYPPSWFHGVSWVADQQGVLPLKWRFHPQCGCCLP